MGGRALLPTFKKIKNDKTLTTNIYHIIHTLYIIPSARRNKYISGRALGLFLFDDNIDYVHVHVWRVEFKIRIFGTTMTYLPSYNFTSYALHA